MYANGLRTEIPDIACPDRLPVRVPGDTGVPDGPVAVPLPIERLEHIARAVRRWCADTGGARGRC